MGVTVNRWRLAALVVLGGTVPPITLPGQSAPSPSLDRWELRAEDPEQARLPNALREISGLTFDASGRLWAHQDEFARVYRIDPLSGRVVDRFDAGRGAPGDWEGIAFARGFLYLVDSDGFLLRFRPGSGGERVPLEGVPTGLGRLCEVEGLTHDPVDDVLILACKTPRTKLLENRIALFAVDLDSLTLQARPRLLVRFEALEAVDLDDGFQPSGVEVDPRTGSFLLVAARQEAVLELARDGTPLAAVELRGKDHPQVEGIALAPDGTLFLASEGDGGRGRLTRFTPIPRGGSSP